MWFKRYKLSKVLILIGLLLTIISVFFILGFQDKVRPERPNVLLITIDALRYDHLSCYGYEKNTSPNIDTLGKEGAVFTQAISQAPETIPSLPSLMTSLYSSQHGVKTISSQNTLTVSTLAEILKANGYHTMGIVAHFLRHTGITRGFDSVDFIKAAKADIITQEAAGWLSKNKDKRFFLWLHYFDPHPPYTPFYPYDELFLSSKFKEKGKEFLAKKYYWILPRDLPKKSAHSLIPPKAKENDKDFFGEEMLPGEISPNQCLDHTLTAEDREYYISQYDGEIRFADYQIGILLHMLKVLGLDKQTLVILTADHGENLADYHQSFFHGDSLYDVLLRVPLIIKSSTLPKHKVINRQVQLIDIMPTIFDILKIRTDIKMEGISLLPLVLNKKHKIRDYAFSEVYQPLNAISIRTEEWKLIYYLSKNRYELFNLKSDSRERDNLVNSEKKEFEFLEAELAKLMKLARPKEAPLTTKPLDEETKEKLRSLGYVQ